MQDPADTNPDSNEAKHPPGRTPASGTDSGSASVPGGGTGNRGVGGAGTAGGSNTGKPPVDAPATPDNKPPTAQGNPNDVGPAGDYSR